MFDNLTQRLTETLRQVRGQAKLSEDNIKDTLREVRMALLEADVALSVVRDFLERLKLRAVGQEVSKSLTPGQAFLKIVNEELVELMGTANHELNLATQPPAVILMAGLQGAGKTTTVAKLAQFIKNQKKTCMVVSADVYRPAAIKQLETLAHSVGAEFFPSETHQKPVKIVNQAIKAAKKQLFDVLIIDTAGRLAVDDDMMNEIKELHKEAKPIETLFVVDAMTGQDAANTAKAFNDVLPLTGVVLTKADGDARGGAALSVRAITQKPIKFIGMGEKTDALEPFYPERIASRILGMGDMMSLIEEAERKIDKTKATKLANKIKRGKRFDLNDFKEQLQQMKNMGGMASMLDKIPGLSGMTKQIESQVNDKALIHMEALINSMTPQERRFPDSINGSRKKRISKGSGLQIQDVNRLLKQHKQMQKMMGKMSKKGGMSNMMRGLGGMMSGGGGGFPPMR